MEDKIREVFDEYAKSMCMLCEGNEYVKEQSAIDTATLIIKQIFLESKAIKLLEKADNVLSKYWFSSDGEGEEYNNNDVIELNKEITEYLAEIKAKLTAPTQQGITGQEVPKEAE